ncbi:MAG: Ig-like domain-containing protein, partial [Aeromicrobium sp.]
LVDNTPPAVTMTNPGSPLSGTRTFAATATDADSGVAQVVIEYAVSGSSTYKTLCTITDAPYSCRYATTNLTNGTYSFRAVATDVAGSSTTSSVITSRVIDNTAASVSVEDPGQYLSGSVAVTASASSTVGIASVRIQRAPTGTGTWTDICVDTTAPFACTFATTAVPDGSYDVRAVLLDTAGTTSTSATVSARLVDNSAVRAIDVQAANGGGTAGKLDSGDLLTYTYSERLNLASLLAGWDGTATAVSLRLRDGGLVGLGSTGDTVDVLKGTTSVNLGPVVLNRDFIKNSKAATFNATITASTSASAGANRTIITLKLGSLASGNGLKTATAGTMQWAPSAAAADLSGNKCSVTPATESGSADRDF